MSDFPYAPPLIQDVRLSDRQTLRTFRLTLAQQRLAVLALTIGSFLLRVPGLGAQSLWRDEVDAIWFALRPLEQTLSMFTEMAQNGALFFLGLRPWLQMMGTSEFVLRLPSAMAGVAAVPMLWLLARRLVGEGIVPLLAAALLAINPYAVWYGQEGKMYTIITFLALVASWCWIHGAETRKWRWWFAYAAILSLAMYTHLLAILIIPLHLLWFFIAFPTARRSWKGYLTALALLTLPYLPLLAWQWRMLLADRPVTGFQFTPLPEMLRTILLNQARGFMPGDPLLWLAPIWFVGAIGLLLGFTEMGVRRVTRQSTPISPTRRFLMLATWAIVPILSIWAISMRQAVFTDRYVIWTLPAVMILVALGLQVLRANLGEWGAPLAAAGLVYILLFWLVVDWQQRTNVIKYDLRAAVQQVAAERDPDSLLILQIPHLEYAYRYYSSDMGTQPFAGSTERLGNWVGGVWTNGEADDGAAQHLADQQMRALTRHAGEVWVILSEAEMWDRRRLMDQWLAENGELTLSNDYHGVRVRRYDMR